MQLAGSGENVASHTRSLSCRWQSTTLLHELLRVTHSRTVLHWKLTLLTPYSHAAFVEQGVPPTAAPPGVGHVGRTGMTFGHVVLSERRRAVPASVLDAPLVFPEGAATPALALPDVDPALPLAPGVGEPEFASVPELACGPPSESGGSEPV